VVLVVFVDSVAFGQNGHAAAFLVEVDRCPVAAVVPLATWPGRLFDRAAAVVALCSVLNQAWN
jgi:hypothetical protein